MLDIRVLDYVFDGEAPGGVVWYLTDNYSAIARTTARAWHDLEGLSPRESLVPYLPARMVQNHV